MYLYITHMLIQVVGVLTSWALQFVPCRAAQGLVTWRMAKAVTLPQLS